MARVVRTTCGYCAVGCHIEATVADDGKVRVKGVADSPVNRGLLCPKGMTITQPFTSPGRFPHPLFRDRKGGERRQISMDEALKTFVSRLKSVQQRYGDEAAAYYSTGQFTTEDFAMLGAVGRIGMKMEGDGNTRLCMASAVVGYKQTLGFDAPPFSYEDIEQSDCVVIIGVNPPINQPVFWAQYKKSASSRDHDLVVIDPRTSEVAQQATFHLKLKPKGDLALLYTLANTLISQGWVDHDYIKQHVSGYDEFKNQVRPFTLDRAMENCGVSGDDILRLARIIHQRKRVSFWWAMGINQGYEGVRTCTTIVAISLITGNIGRPGTGPNSITGQCNAMGSRLHSNTTCMFGARDFANPEHRQQVADWLGIEVSRIPTRATLPIDKIFERIDQGKIKFLWVLATNPVQSFVDIPHLKRVLAKLDTLVVQDLYHDTPTAEMADLFLPAAGCAEKEGSFINMERRVSAVNPILTPPGEALSDFEICRRLAHEYGCEDVIKGWDTPDKVFHLLKDFTAGRPCDYSGIRDRQQLVEVGGIQWPHPKGAPVETHRRMFGDGHFFTADGRAKLIFENLSESPVKFDENYPFIALTGRDSIVLFQTNTRTQHVPALLKMARSNELYVDINPEDMRALQLEENDMVEVSSPNGSLQARAVASEGVERGQIFIPMHYLQSNFTTKDDFDPYSHQPSLKYAAVQVQKLTAGNTASLEQQAQA